MLVQTTALAPLEISLGIVRDPLVVSPETRLMDAIALMSGVTSWCNLNQQPYTPSKTAKHPFPEARSSCVVVVEHKRVVGILTERDVVRLSAQQQPFHDLTMRQVMTPPALVMHESTFADIFSAINLLHQHKIRHLIVLDDHDDLIGFITHETLHQAVGQELNERIATIAEIVIEHQQTEEALQESEIRWQFALEGAGDGIWDWNIETNQVFLSQQWKAMLGYADHEVGSTILEWENRVHPDDKDYCYRELQKHFRGEIPAYQAEHRLLCKDGSYKWILARGKVMEWDETNQPRRIIGTHSDISDRKQADEQLQNLIEGTATTTGEDFFPALVNNITKVLNVPYAIVSELVDQTLHTLAFSANSALQPNFSFCLAKTPCERAVQDGSYYCEALVQEQFPEDLDLVALKAESYLGIALSDNQGNSIGNLCILGKQPIQERLRAEQILRLFAARAMAELERKRANYALEQLNQELDNKVKARTVDLESSEKRYQALMDGASDAILLADIHGNLLEGNQKAEVLFGYGRADLTTLHFTQIHPFSVLSLGQEHFKDTVENNSSPTFESAILRKDGSQVPVEITANCIELEGERFVQGIFRDISDRKLAEAKINQQLASIEAAIDGIGILTDKTTYLYLNQSHLNLFGYDHQEELVGKSWKILYSQAELERFEHEVFPVLERERSWQGEATATRKDGSTFAQGLSLSITEEGFIICVCRDISEQKAVLHERQQSEAKLQQTNEELARATRLKDEFLANMSHELRTPLNAILGMTEGLHDQVFGEINQPQVKALQTISRSASHLLELINDILDVAKIESGQIELDCAPTNVALLCRSSLAFITQQALKKRIQVETKLSFNLPDLYVDERRIRQVLINLLNNAVKFTPEGGSITLEASYEQYSINGLDFTNASSQNFLYISVIDTGIGIASEQIDRLFKPFIQIDSALNRQYTGTGLGLALVKRIVELHGGQVSLNSEVGIGSCFTITLPYTISTISSPAAPISSSNSTEVRKWGQTKTPLILLAEDNESNIITISSYLGAKGYDLLVATNGREAVMMAQIEKPDLILMDIQMPEMDGLEAIQHIRSNPDLAQTPIIALTALAMPGDRERCLAVGANDYISKPIKLKHLAITIQQLLST